MSEPQWLCPWRARVAVIVHVVIYCWAWTHHEILQGNYVQTISPCPLSFHDNDPSATSNSSLCPLVYLDEESKITRWQFKQTLFPKTCDFHSIKTVSPGECRSMGRERTDSHICYPELKWEGSLLLHFLKPRILPLWIYMVLPLWEPHSGH